MAKTKEKAPKLTLQERAENDLWHALAVVAKKRTNRKALVSGKSRDVSLTISAKVGRKTLRVRVDGNLTVAQVNPTGSTNNPKADFLIGHLIGMIPEQHRSKIVAKLKKLQADPGALPEPSKELLAHAEQIRKKLSKSGPKNGAVQFDHQVR